MHVSHRLAQKSREPSTTRSTESLVGPLADPLAGPLADQLRAAAQARRAQLASLPNDPSLVTSPVAAAHRSSVARILDSIEAAQARLAAGTYGFCTRCEHGIDERSLQLRPWTTLCDPCIRR